MSYSSEIMIAVISLIGTLAGSYFSNRRTSALLQYRLEQLEKKVEKHNSTIERTFKLEERMAIVENDIEDLKNK